MSAAELRFPLPAVILAGGQGRRMGRVKAQVVLGDKELLLHAVELVQGSCVPIVVSVRQSDVWVFELLKHSQDVTVVCDRDATPTPMAGIVSSLEYLCSQASHDWVLITSCDTMYHPWQLISTLAEKAANTPECTAAVFRIQNKYMPFPGLFRMDTLQAWKNALQNHRLRVQEFLASLPKLQCVDAQLLDSAIPDWYIANINTAHDLTHALEIMTMQRGTSV